MTEDTQELLERIEGCIANAEHDDEWQTLIDARDCIETIAARNEQLTAEVERLREALEPFAFREMEKDNGLADTQYVWETIYSDRVQDWFSYEEIEAARAALEGKQ